MTTPAHSDLAYTLTRYYFGDRVASVIQTLFNFDQASLKLLRSCQAEIKTNELKRSLLILVKYQLVDYIKTVKNFSQQYEYSVVPQRIFSFFRIPRFIHMIRSKEGPIAAVILTKLMEKALLSRDKLKQFALDEVKSGQPDADLTKLTSQISDLIDRLILRRYIVQTSNNLCINFDRFNRNLRDDLIVDAIHTYYSRDNKIKSLCRTILDLTVENTNDDAPLTSPATLLDLTSALVPEIFVDKAQLERYLEKLTSESNNRFFLTCGVHPNRGPMFAVNIGFVVDFLVKEHLSSVVATRFGPKCCRVFRVLLSRGPLLLKQIEEIIMLPARDVREYSYMLMKEGFIRNRQIPKTPDNAPGKSVFIMSVELDQVVYDATDLCCRSINNILVRHEFELSENKILLDKSREFLDSNVAKDEWNQYFTSHELSQLEKINFTMDKLLLAKVQVDETLFLLHTWLNISPNMEVDDF